MAMPRSRVILLALALAALALPASLPAISQSPAPSKELTGTVKDANGQPMEGVAVSARAAGSPIRTSVWTNQDGAYAFPALDAARYEVSAQAVGFDRPVAEATVAPGNSVRQDFTLKPLPNIVGPQLSSAEWLARLPEDTAQDRRMKMVVLNNCSNCHGVANWLEKRFDSSSWETMMDHMTNITNAGGPPAGGRPGGGEFTAGKTTIGEAANVRGQLMLRYRKDLVEYLTKVAGPKPVALNPIPWPRPKGIETQIVVTEYDMNWARPDGLGQLDPRTGAVKFFMLRDGKTVSENLPHVPQNPFLTGEDWTWGTREHQGFITGSHDIALGSDGNVYFDWGSMGMDISRDTIWGGGRMFTSFNVKTQTLKNHPTLPHSTSHGVDVDTKGNVWGNHPVGAVRMNIGTGEITEFPTLLPNSRPYDLGIDRMDNAWVSQIGIDKMMVVDGRTGDVTNVSIPPFKSPDIRPEDIEAFNTIGSWDHNASLGQQGPRRMAADRRGDYVYAGTYWTGNIAQFDIRTKTLVKLHPVPNGRWGQPYKPFPDKNHMVWFSMAHDDSFGKLNPTTGQITMYPLPSRGTNSRHFAVDDSTNPPTIWVPYDGIAKTARVQFRHDTSR
jgi:streptogramin lyase